MSAARPGGDASDARATLMARRARSAAVDPVATTTCVLAVRCRSGTSAKQAKVAHVSDVMQ